MASRVLDSRLASLATLADDADVGVVSGQVAVILSELHLTIQAKKYDVLLAGDGFNTVGSLQLLTETNLMELGVAPGHIALVLNAFFPLEERVLDEPLKEDIIIVTSPPPHIAAIVTRILDHLLDSCLLSSCSASFKNSCGLAFLYFASH